MYNIWRDTITELHSATIAPFSETSLHTAAGPSTANVKSAGGKKAAKTHKAASAPKNAPPTGIDFAFCKTSFNLSFSLGGYDHWIPLIVKSID